MLGEIPNLRWDARIVWFKENAYHDFWFHWLWPLLLYTFKFVLFKNIFTKISKPRSKLFKVGSNKIFDWMSVLKINFFIFLNRDLTFEGIFSHYEGVFGKKKFRNTKVVGIIIFKSESKLIRCLTNRKLKTIFYHYFETYILYIF